MTTAIEPMITAGGAEDLHPRRRVVDFDRRRLSGGHFEHTWPSRHRALGSLRGKRGFWYHDGPRRELLPARGLLTP